MTTFDPTKPVQTPNITLVMKMTEPTWCESCDNVHPASRKREPYYWLCIKFPRLEGHGFVSRKYWTDQEPYMRCNGINGGSCCLFTPLPDNLNRKG